MARSRHEARPAAGAHTRLGRKISALAFGGRIINTASFKPGSKTADETAAVVVEAFTALTLQGLAAAFHPFRVRHTKLVELLADACAFLRAGLLPTLPQGAALLRAELGHHLARLHGEEGLGLGADGGGDQSEKKGEEEGGFHDRFLDGSHARQRVQAGCFGMG